jgi:DNA/RNA-binding domain of Phe-tRNA-synthetase-like protein
MRVQINKEVFKKFSNKFKVILITVKDFDNSAKLMEARHLVSEIEQMTKLIFTKETVKNHVLISPWEVAKIEFGKNAKHYHTSVEKLLQSVLKGKKVETKDTLTSLFRYLSLKHIVPGAVDDLDKINIGITFSLLDRKKKANFFKDLLPGELCYHDSKQILGAKLDYWKNKKTALSNKSTNALMHFEILPPINKKKMDDLVSDARSLVNAFCGGKVKVTVLSKSKSSANV